jgi:hypothetical protein
MATARKSTTRRASTARKSPSRRTTARKSSASGEPAAIRRLNKSLDSAQEALKTLRKDVGREVGTGTRGLYGDLQKFIRDARRDSTKLGKALSRDVQQLQKRLSSAATGRSSSRSGGTKSSGTRRKSASRSTSGRSTSARTSARSGSRSRSK